MEQSARHFPKAPGAIDAGTVATWLIAALFVVLKVTHLTEWGWVWVLAPIWIWMITYAGLAIMMIIAAYYATRDKQ
jgi:hypothetical protein